MRSMPAERSVLPMRKSPAGTKAILSFAGPVVASAASAAAPSDASVSTAIARFFRIMLSLFRGTGFHACAYAAWKGCAYYTTNGPTASCRLAT